MERSRVSRALASKIKRGPSTRRFADEPQDDAFFVVLVIDRCVLRAILQGCRAEGRGATFKSTSPSEGRPTELRVGRYIKLSRMRLRVRDEMCGKILVSGQKARAVLRENRSG